MGAQEVDARVDVAVLREAFARSHRTPSQIAAALGWFRVCSASDARRDGRRRVEPDSSRVTRAMGLRPDSVTVHAGREYGGKPRRTTSYERAVELVMAMGFDPVDLDL